MLEFKEVTFQYEGADHPLIENLSFHISKGSFTSIIGASGSGKTTIFRLLNGLEHIRSGEILLEGENISGMRNFCSYMPQNDLLLPWSTVEKNVCLPMRIQGVKKTEQKQIAARMLDLVGLGDVADKYPRELSGGMRQRVAFARTLCAGSDLLLLDEPFSALDYLTRISLQEWLLDQWMKLNKTILFITHDVEEALFLSKEIYVVADRPVRRMELYQVPMDYPRTREMLIRSDIQELKEELIRKMREGDERIRKVRGPRLPRKG